MPQTVSELRREARTLATWAAELLKNPRTATLEQVHRATLLTDLAQRKKYEIDRAEGRTMDPATREAIARAAQYRAFTNYLRFGIRGGKLPGISEEDRALLRPVQAERRVSEGFLGGAYPGSTSGFLVPVEFAEKVEFALKFHSDFWATSTIIKTERGGPFGYPTSDDSSVSGELLYENLPYTTSNSDIASTGQVNFSTYKFSSRLVKVSMELAQDAWAGFEDYLAEQLAIRLARAATPFFTTGQGASYMSGSPLVGTPQPRGIMLDAVDSGVTVIGDDSQTTPDPTQQVGALDLIHLEHSVDVAYRRRGAWLMHDDTLKFIQNLRDKNNRPIWTEGIGDGGFTPEAPSGRIRGYPVRISQSMDTLGAGKKPVLFGDLSRYAIRSGPSWTIRLIERFVEQGQLGYVVIARWDAALLDAGQHPVKYLTLHA
jgi:HK97 family phage major capsid protein